MLHSYGLDAHCRSVLRDLTTGLAFQKGNCRYGAGCSFRHGPSDKRPLRGGRSGGGGSGGGGSGGGGDPGGTPLCPSCGSRGPGRRTGPRFCNGCGLCSQCIAADDAPCAAGSGSRAFGEARARNVREAVGLLARAPLPYGCPNGHALKPFTTHKSSFTCDACRCSVPKDAPMASCRECDFDARTSAFTLP